MLQERLNELAMIAIEIDLLKNIKYENWLMLLLQKMLEGRLF
jgi:hypothetical protein